MPKVIHIKIDQMADGPINTPATLCGLDPRDRKVAWASPESFRELMDGEIQGVAPCTLCVAGLADKIGERASE